MKIGCVLSEFYIIDSAITDLTRVTTELRKCPEGSVERYRAELIGEALQFLSRAFLDDAEMVALRSEDLPFQPEAYTDGWVERHKNFFQLRTLTKNCFIEGGPLKGWKWTAQRPPSLGEREWKTKQGVAKMLADAKRTAEAAFEIKP